MWLASMRPAFPGVSPRSQTGATRRATAQNTSHRNPRGRSILVDAGMGSTSAFEAGSAEREVNWPTPRSRLPAPRSLLPRYHRPALTHLGRTPNIPY